MTKNRKATAAVIIGIYAGLFVLGGLLVARDGFEGQDAAIFAALIAAITAGIAPLYAGTKGPCGRCKPAADSVSD